jgi:hypothetical protein
MRQSVTVETDRRPSDFKKIKILIVRRAAKQSSE